MTIRVANGLMLLGGPMRKISVDGKIILFEMHPYCGPTLLNRRGDPLPVDKHPMAFLHAASQWTQQGEKIDENGLCIWHHDPEPILEVRYGMRFLVGEKPAIKGS